MSELIELLNGKTVRCRVLQSEEKQGPKAVYYILTIEPSQPIVGHDGSPFEANTFQKCLLEHEYDFAFTKSSKGGLVATRPKSTEEEKVAAKAKEIEEREKRKAKEAAEKAAYEADNVARGISPNPSPADAPAATLIKPTETHVALAGEYGYTAKQVALMQINGIIPPNTPPAQIAFFFETAKARGLSPITKQIYLLPFVAKEGDAWITKYAIIVGIDGMRARAEDTKQLAGISEPLFDGMTLPQWFAAGNKFPTYKATGSGKDTRYILESGNEPNVCTVVVKRKQGGDVSEYTGIATWGEYYPGPVPKGGQWRKMPFVMLAKCAKAQALRDAFSSAIGGLHVEEEFHRQQVAEQPKDATFQDWDAITRKVDAAQTIEELAKVKEQHPELGNDPDFLQALESRAVEITNN